MPCNVPTPIEKTERKMETGLSKWVGLKTKVWDSALRVRSFGLQLLQFNGEAFKPPPNCGQSPPRAFVNLLPQTRTPANSNPELQPSWFHSSSRHHHERAAMATVDAIAKPNAGSWNLECAYPKHVLQKPKKV